MDKQNKDKENLKQRLETSEKKMEGLQKQNDMLRRDMRRVYLLLESLEKINKRSIHKYREYILKLK